jgi:predicted aldo/keto reductase-like oxidoreductase
MRRFDFDTVLVALNAADVHRLSFIHTVLADAHRRGMGVIGMKACGGGTLVGSGRLPVSDALGYVWSLPGVSNIIVGCKTPEEVDENVRAARDFQPFADEQMRRLEARTQKNAAVFSSFKSSA